MFQCPRCNNLFEDHEARTVLENPADSYSRFLTVCSGCAERQARISCFAGLGLLGFIVVMILAFFSFCRL